MNQEGEDLPLSLKELEEYFNDELGEKLKEFRTEKIEKGISNKPMKLIWMRVARESFRDAVETIADIQLPHLSVASGSDKGDFVELIYHFMVNYGYPEQETALNLKVNIPKDDLTIPTITDIVPGAITTEREKQEFLGIDVIDIPDDRRMWLDENYPEDKYPWRWDDEGMESMSRHVHEKEQTFEKPVSERVEKEEDGD